MVGLVFRKQKCGSGDDLREINADSFCSQKPVTPNDMSNLLPAAPAL